MDNTEEVIVGCERFVHNLVAGGVKVEELPDLYKIMTGYAVKLTEIPEYDQTS